MSFYNLGLLGWIWFVLAISSTLHYIGQNYLLAHDATDNEDAQIYPIAPALMIGLTLYWSL